MQQSQRSVIENMTNGMQYTVCVCHIIIIVPSK